ncbi:DUF309 domain-containing protein [Streptomyces sp. NPDC059740]|uniref:DUF309 domain-containing protein n=1 Tax=Streptomyces sp. NPDC059740 TaxID=3346926 RepID=UPI00365838F7
MDPAATGGRDGGRDRDSEGRARNARPRDGLGRPLPYGSPGVARAPEGVRRTPQETLTEAQRLLDAGMPFHAHEVLEDAWKTGPAAERELWRGMAQLAVGLTHAARGNLRGGARLLRRGAVVVAAQAQDGEDGGPGPRTTPVAARPGGGGPHGIDVTGLARWAVDLADHLTGPVDAAAHAPRLRAGG